MGVSDWHSYTAQHRFSCIPKVLHKFTDKLCSARVLEFSRLRCMQAQHAYVGIVRVCVCVCVCVYDCVCVHCLCVHVWYMCVCVCCCCCSVCIFCLCIHICLFVCLFTRHLIEPSSGGFPPS